MLLPTESTYIALALAMLMGEVPRVLCEVLVADHTMSRMIELTSKSPYCKLHGDRGVIQRMVLASDPRKVRQMTNGAITALESACRDRSLLSPHQGGFVYPGTKWCGPGNRASAYKDLGVHSAEDRCCREHDHCPSALAPGECRRSVCNQGRYTRSHCDCDARFRRCLQALNTETANTLGAVFFNVVQVTCFKERRPCSQWQKPQNQRCDPTPVFVKMPHYQDYRNPYSLKNLFLLGDNQVARFNQGITVALGSAIKSITTLFD